MSVQQRLTFLTTRRRQLMAGLFAGLALIATGAWGQKEYLRTGEKLDTNQYLQSANKAFFAIQQSDGNLCVYRGTPAARGPGGAVWCHMKHGAAGEFTTAMQGDGNFCTYRTSKGAIQGGATWCTMALTPGGQYFAIQQNDGNLCVYRGTGPADNKGGAWCHMTNVLPASQVQPSPPAAAAGTVTLTVTPKPTGGAIWVNDQAIRCGNSSAGGNACSITVAKGSVAKAWMFNDTGYTYAGWVGACSGNGQNCNITMDSNKTLSANFGSTQTKNITLTAPQNGSIDWFGGSKCGSQCSRTVNVNSSATLTALPNLGYAVGSWSGACSGSGPTCVVTASKDVSASVSFKHVGTYTVTVSPKPSHGAVWVENQRCRCGDSGAGGNACSCQVTRGATTSAWQFNDSGYNYTGWTGACASSGKSQNCNIKMDGDKTVSAGFAK